MITIREISEYTGLSPSTVSIVLNGKTKSRNISEKTARKILDAARELGYTPNISARRLRNNNTKKYVAVFWANDYRAPLLFEFLNGIQKHIESSGTEIEIVLRLFKPDYLYKSAQPEQLSMYSATVICTASKKDLEYLESTSFASPIVLYNRFSEKYSNVLVDNEALGAKAAEIFASHGKKKAIVFAAHTNHYIYCEKRMSGFMNTFSITGGNTTVINSPENRYQAAFDTISEMEGVFCNADCVFFLHDLLAISYINYIHRKSIVDVPSSQEIISIGIRENDKYDNLLIPLSIIEVPIEAMGRECMRIVEEWLGGDYYHSESKTMDFIYTPRLSCK
jgi:LacI family transcriptional regulator